MRSLIFGLKFWGGGNAIPVFLNSAGKGSLLDISGKDCRDVPWNVSTGVSCHAYLIFGDVYCVINSVSLLNINFCWCKMSGRKLGAIKLITRDSNRGLCLEIS